MGRRARRGRRGTSVSAPYPSFETPRGLQSSLVFDLLDGQPGDGDASAINRAWAAAGGWARRPRLGGVERTGGGGWGPGVAAAGTTPPSTTGRRRAPARGGRERVFGLCPFGSQFQSQPHTHSGAGVRTQRALHSTAAERHAAYLGLGQGGGRGEGGRVLVHFEQTVRLSWPAERTWPGQGGGCGACVRVYWYTVSELYFLAMSFLSKQPPSLVLQASDP